MKKSLLVVDMQEVCVGENHADFFQYDADLIDRVNEIIDRNRDCEVVYIRNLMKRNTINKFAPFQAYEGTKEVELVSTLHIVSNQVYDKYTGNAFSNDSLDQYLKFKDIEEVELIGVDGGGCVPLTAFGALSKGYHVIVNTKGIGTMFEKKKSKFFAKLTKQGAQIIDS